MPKLICITSITYDLTYSYNLYENTAKWNFQRKLGGSQKNPVHLFPMKNLCDIKNMESVKFLFSSL